MAVIGLAVVPLTPERWGDLEDLFGPQGPCYGCWCNHFRMPQRLRKPLLGEGARRLFEERVRQGPPPGVLAYAEGKAVGWLQVGPRADIPEWNNPRRASRPLRWRIRRSAVPRGSMSGLKACFGAPASPRWRDRSREGPCSG